MKEEPQEVKLPAYEGGQNNHCGGRGCNRNRWNNSGSGGGPAGQGHPVAKFPTRSKELPVHVVLTILARSTQQIFSTP